ncbi:hypothetical protein Y032_0331g2713 [Ancylostoma ceylanicum]|uniref:C2H2-type domain-containing protein n=1 Tax=Ancylostoma ceylanicum TaxID=53326 RepID=A0A016RZZ8_9BILA|nr:hypothetical protein Y032_0331g2713 [Ancylostoma ceylanicum]
MPYPKRGRLQKPAEEVEVEAEAPIVEASTPMSNDLELDVTETPLEHDLIEDESMLEGAEEVEVEYVDDNGIPVPEMAEEVVMEGDYVEEYIDAEEDDMAESLVALSRSGEFRDKGGGEYVVENVEARRRAPRILRRFGAGQHQQFVEQTANFVDGGQIVVEEFQPVASAGRDTRFTPKYPVAVARRPPTINLRSSYPKGDWREDQRKKLLVCDVFESLPEHKQETFKKLMDIFGTSVPPFRTPSKRKYPGNSPGYYPDAEGDSVSPRQTSQKGRTVTFGKDLSTSIITHPRFTDQPRYVVTNPSSSNARVMAMIPFEEKASTEAPDRVDTGDMPELIQNDINEGDKSGDPHDGDEAGDVDIETYEEDNSREHRKSTLWVDNKGRVVDVVPGRGGHATIIYPEMRQEVFGTSDLRSLAASHPKETPDERFCPSCRMTMKRSIFYHHGRLIRKYGRCDIFTPKRFPCGSPGCHERLGTLERLCEHMYQVHRAPTDIKRRVFENEAQFEEFLRELESRGGNFRMSRGNKTIKEGIVQYFRCNRIFSIAKDKALRIVDDINAGTYEAVKDITQPMDPFGKETSTKPYLRTEEACTAFFRKTYLNDGTIEVRYCDYHLHGDERLRLPTAIRNRIYEMSKKKLPLPVIVMVLHRECHRFCMPGTALERRIMAVTPREVQLVAQSVQRRLDAAARRKKAAEGHEHTNGGDHVDADHEREDHEAAENIMERGDGDDHHDDSQDHLEPADEAHEDDGGGTGEGGLDFSTEGRGEGGELTELELTMLEEYEQNRGVILTDFQSLKREENRKRLCRERVRARIYTLGRAMRNIQFSDFECDLLIRSEQMLEAVVDLWNARMESGTKLDPSRLCPKREFYSGAPEASAEAATEHPEPARDHTPTAATEEGANMEEGNTPETPVNASSESMGNETDTTPTGSSTSVRKTAKPRQRRALRVEKIKEEPVSTSPVPPSPPASPPAVTRLGRVIKRKKILDV